MILESLLSKQGDAEVRPLHLRSRNYPRNRQRSSSDHITHQPLRKQAFQVAAAVSVQHRQSPEGNSRDKVSLVLKDIHLSPLDLFNPIHESLLLPHQIPAHPKSRKRQQEKPRTNRGKMVTFNPQVTVHEIPSHRDLEPEERNRLWISWDHFAADVRRNAMEFVADGSDWQNATEEDQFQVLPSGELVHPFTYQLSLYNAQQQKSHESSPQDSNGGLSSTRSASPMAGNRLARNPAA